MHLVNLCFLNFELLISIYFFYCFCCVAEIVNFMLKIFFMNFYINKHVLLYVCIRRAVMHIACIFARGTHTQVLLQAPNMPKGKYTHQTHTQPCMNQCIYAVKLLSWHNQHCIDSSVLSSSVPYRTLLLFVHLSYNKNDIKTVGIHDQYKLDFIHAMLTLRFQKQQTNTAEQTTHLKYSFTHFLT